MANDQTPHVRSRVDFVEDLRRQLRRLERGGKAFDDGDEEAALDLAVCIRVLLHDVKGSDSQSLLSLLGVKEKLVFVDTAAKPGRGKDKRAGISGLHSLTISGTGMQRYIPRLGTVVPSQPKPFQQWWGGMTVMLDTKKNRFTRKKFVLGTAHMAGGAHISTTLDRDFHDVTELNSAGWSMARNGGPDLPFDGNVAFVSVRQISYELLLTLREQLPALVPEF